MMNNPSNDAHEPDSTPEIENMGLNQLNDLGNRAIALGLIAGHGHRQGQYEMIRQAEVVTLSPQEALTYLQDLIQSASGAQ